MNCPYCQSVFTIASDVQPKVARCRTCKRHILFFRGISGMRLSTSEIPLPLPTAIRLLLVLVGVLSVLLSILVPYLFALPGSVWIGPLRISACVGLVMILTLVHEGYLSVRTGIMKHKNQLIRGRWAILLGLIQIGVSIAVLAFLIATFGSLVV